jgi:hypothetical protein
VSITGHASGPAAVSGCDLVAQACVPVG